MSLSEKIKTSRARKIISQERLAEQMNVSHQLVSEWEMGTSLPDLENIVKLSEVLDVSLDYLLKNMPLTPQKQWWETSFAYNNEDNDVADKGSLGESMIYPLALVTYLIIGFVWGMWHPGWLVFPAAWSIGEIIIFSKSNKREVEFYGIASLIFFVLGFHFDLWQYAWLSYVVAAIIEAATTSRKI